MSEVYGDILDSDLIEGWVEAHLKSRMPEYLAEVSRQRGLDKSIQKPRSYVRSADVNKMPEDQLPSIVIVCPGLAERPLMEGDGKYRARFSLGLACITTGRNRKVTNRVSKMYAAAARAAVLQHGSLGRDEVMGVDWQDESYDDLPFDDVRTLGIATVLFRVEVRGVLDTGGGLPEPPDDPEDPPEGYPPTEEVIIAIDQQEV